MCQQRSTVIAELSPDKKVRCDPCIRHLLETMYRHGIRTVASCCGHGRYPVTIIAYSKLNDHYWEVCSGKQIRRTRNFYKMDKNGYYFVPEVSQSHDKKTVGIPLEYAKNIHKVLENHVSMGFAIVSQEIKDVVSQEAYDKLTDIFNEYHNANCGPFNRTLKKMIEEVDPY